MSKRKKKKQSQTKTNKVTAPSTPNNDEVSPTKVKQEPKKSEAKPKAADNVKANLEAKHPECEKERDAKTEELGKLKKREAELDERESKLNDREDKINCHENLDEREARLNEREEKIKTESENLNKSKAELDQREKALDDRESELDQRDKSLNKREKDILDREEDIKRRELDAEAGFTGKRRESLARLETETEILRDELSNCRKQIADERAEWIKEKREARKAFDAELAEKRKAYDEKLLEEKQASDAEISAIQEELEKDRSELEEATRNLRKNQRNFDIDLENFEEDKQHFYQRIEAKAAARVERLQSEKQEIQARLEAARQDRDQLQKLLNEREEADRRFGHKTPDEIFGEMKALREERDQLRKQLDSRPGEDATERLRKLEADREDWESQKIQDQNEIAELKIRLERAAIGATELETLRDQKKALESSREALQAALDELRTDVEERIKGVESKSPFPAFRGMDKDSNLKTPVPMTDKIPDLTVFAEDLQQRIAYDPETEKVLYYSMRDIRSFLGGLAMSHLHLLYGISGTGKTSLPLAFARAVGAECTLVEVQAGWRDRQDLLGHFNAFERRYYESEFLQALYKAQCPKYEERLYVIVLDEMNLSHPEQYFADMLSALEKPDEKDRLLTLMTAPVEPAPTMLKKGRKLWIPSNVWFVGTANHDETTKDFADKTYDRSHVMELPRHRERFDPEDCEYRDPIASEALKDAFENAKDQYSDEAEEAYQYLEDQLGNVLWGRFGVGWGNRLERQMESYVPVVIAAGGSIGEATDHILTTKILRKIRDRYDNNADDLRELKQKIENSWSELIKGEKDAVEHKAVRSLGIISDELRRLGEDEGS